MWCGQEKKAKRSLAPKQEEKGWKPRSFFLDRQIGISK